jgi:hypothetical protein
MPAFTISTLSSRMQVTNTGGNSTAASLVEPVPQTGNPSRAAVSSGVVSVGDGVIPLGDGGSECASAIMLMFFGVGTNGQSFNCNIYGWSLVDPPVGANLGSELWLPHPLITLTSITLNSSIPGVLNTAVPATNYFASAMTIGLGASGVNYDIISPGSGTAEIASIVISTKGIRWAELRFNMNSSATSGNAVWKRM